MATKRQAYVIDDPVRDDRVDALYREAIEREFDSIYAFLKEPNRLSVTSLQFHRNGELATILRDISRPKR